MVLVVGVVIMSVGFVVVREMVVSLGCRLATVMFEACSIGSEEYLLLSGIGECVLGSLLELHSRISVLPVSSGPDTGTFGIWFLSFPWLDCLVQGHLPLYRILLT